MEADWEKVVRLQAENNELKEEIESLKKIIRESEDALSLNCIHNYSDPKFCSEKNKCERCL